MRKRILWLLVIVVVLAAGLSVWSHRFGVPEDFSDMEAQFKYGSLGSDHPLTRGIPYWIWKVLPEMFPPSEVMPEGFRPKNGKKGYAAFGLVTEAQKDRPIGFSKRRVFGIDFVGLNCAFCHLSTLRKTPRDEEPEIILGGVGNGVDIEKFFLFLFAAIGDRRFAREEVMKEILRQNPDMSFLERFIYGRVMLPAVRYYTGQLKIEFDFIEPQNPRRLPEFGPGRVDTWAAYKRTFVHPPQRDSIPGVADFPSIWNQKARVGMRMHWDGNIDVLEERNIISALGVIGPRLNYLDFPRLTRVTHWIPWLLPPRYEDRVPEQFHPGKTQRIQRDLAERGRGLFTDHCAACHAPQGDRIGRVEPNADLVTDGERIRAFTPELAAALNRLGTGSWELRNFRLQNGYVNALLDGIWLRAPYLHNGSVPTLRDLLNKPDKRPKRFCRGNDLYDWKNVGYVSAMVVSDGTESCGEFFLFDTSVAGNGNGGHFYGTDLGEKDKEALIEFLKTL